MVGFLAGAAPDLDAVVALAGPVAYLEQHRGISHSFLMAPLWALLLAIAFSLIRRRRYHWSAYFGVCLLALLIHVTGDLITSYGTRILAPFSDWSPGLNTTFIIDPYVTGLLLTGLLLSLYWRPRIAATTALVAVTALIGYQSTQYRQALDIARAHVTGSAMTVERVEAYPQPLSPWNWKLAITSDDVHYTALLNLRRHTPSPDPGPDGAWWRRILAGYQPRDQLEWVRTPVFGNGGFDALAREVWSQEAFAFYRRFAHLPTTRNVEQHDRHGTCVWYQDLRFQLVGRHMPFVYGMCRPPAADGWRLYRPGDDGPRPL